MEDITRYDYNEDSVWEPIVEDVVGGYVKYDDHCEAMEAQRANHLAIVEKLKADIAQLEKELLDEYERGFFNGACTGYGQS